MLLYFMLLPPVFVAGVPALAAAFAATLFIRELLLRKAGLLRRRFVGGSASRMPGWCRGGAPSSAPSRTIPTGRATLFAPWR